MVNIPPFEEFEQVNENYDGFDPKEAQKRLKEKMQQNLRRYKDAQQREDVYAIKKYELLMGIDKLEDKSLKMKVELHRWKLKWKK